MTDSKHPAVVELPILQYKNEILKNIRNFPITLISGDTGCGKTTKVPQFILEDAKKRNESVNIIVSQPRKIAAITIARRVSKELNCQLGGMVGYQVGLDKKVNKMDKENEITSLLFCTTGVVLQKLIKEKSVSRYSHIILDEIHERDIDTDLVMAILREFLLVSNETRLILMSATLNSSKFAKYFTINDLPREILPPIVEMKVERPYKIDIAYLDDLEKLQISEDAINYSMPTITTEMYQIATKLIILSLKESDKSILVFLPGFYEIESMHTFLRKIEGIENMCLISVLHAQLSSAEQKEAFMPSTLPKVILSTNIAESSVTIPNVESIIDFCLVKNIVVQKESSMASLKLEWASKYNCQQRAGRTGRLCDGKVYRMIHMRYYERHILEETIPEIVRAPLETTILRVKILDREDNPTVIINKTMDPPSYNSIVHSILVLKELGGLQIFDMCDNNFNTNDGDLTYIGHVMASLPIDVRLSKLIVMGYVFSASDDIMMIAALLSINSIFQNRFNRKMDDYLMKLKWAQGSACDAITMLNAFKFWLVAKESRKFADWEEEQKWCNLYGLERKSLHEVLKLIQEIKHRLVDLKLEGFCNAEWKKHEIPFILKVCLAAAFYPNYFMLGRSDEFSEKEVYRGLLGLDPNRTVYFRNMKREQVGEIYVEQIKQKIVDCGIGNETEDMKVTFDSSKIFVQFPEKESMVDNEDYEESIDRLIMSEKVLPEVYKAVKFRKLSSANDMLNRGNRHSDFIKKTSAFKLKVLPTVMAKEYAIEKGIAYEKNGKVEMIKILYDYPELCVLPQISDKVMLGKVTHIDHCGKFFFQPREGDPNVLECIQNSLQKEKLKFTIPKSGDLAVVMFNGKYHRAKIINVLKDYKVVCYFFDFGFTQKLTMRNIFEVNEKIIDEYFFFPERGFHCKLSMVEPSYGKCSRGKWTKASIEVFRELTLNQACEIEVFSFINNIASVELKIEGTNINDTLVKEGYAIRCEESYASRLDHNEREAYQLSTASQWIDRETEFKEKENLMISCAIPAPPPELLFQSIYLEGPYSPLETTITGIAKNTFGLAKIDQKSVNSIAFDACVENYDGQLLVAADIVASLTNGTTLHNVTTMPNIKGLAPILTMIFAPNVIFECDKNFERIIELRSNLGFYPVNFQSYFPQHECSLPVNVKFDAQDFNDINELRFGMSYLLKVENSEKLPDLTDDKKTELLLKVKNLIIKVLQRDREILKPPMMKANKSSFAEKSNVHQKKQVREFLYNQIEFPKLKE